MSETIDDDALDYRAWDRRLTEMAGERRHEIGQTVALLYKVVRGRERLVAMFAMHILLANLKLHADLGRHPQLDLIGRVMADLADEIARIAGPGIPPLPFRTRQ